MLRLPLVLLCTLAADAFTLQSISAQLHQRRVAVTMMADPPGGIQAALKERMKAAMKGGAAAKQELAAVRMMVAALTTKQKETGADEVDDATAQDVLAKVAKMRKESIEMVCQQAVPPPCPPFALLTQIHVLCDSSKRVVRWKRPKRKGSSSPYLKSICPRWLMRRRCAAG